MRFIVLFLFYFLPLLSNGQNTGKTDLYEEITEWLGVKYKYGGVSKAGIDCSAFVMTLYFKVWGINLPRTSKEQNKVTETVTKKNSQEGDLIFFKKGKTINHVGVYLGENKFIHASSSRGVVIDSLTPYWESKIADFGKVNLN